MAVDAQSLFDHLWSAKYLPEYHAQRQLAEQRRAEAFVAGPRVIGSWVLRVMTPYDALVFEGVDSPFITRTPEQATPDELGWALWHLRADTRALWFPRLARDRQILRWRRAWLGRDGKPTPAYFQQLAAFLDYLEEAFAESALPRAFKPNAGGTEDPPPALGTHWLADLLTTLAAELGPRDPLNDLPWGHVPLPQIWQYRRELRARKTGKPPLEDGAPAAVKAQCLDEVNAILTGQKPNPLAL